MLFIIILFSLSYIYLFSLLYIYLCLFILAVYNVRVYVTSDLQRCEFELSLNYVCSD